MEATSANAYKKQINTKSLKAILFTKKKQKFPVRKGGRESKCLSIPTPILSYSLLWHVCYIMPFFSPWSHREAVPRESENSDGAHLEDAGVL